MQLLCVTIVPSLAQSFSPSVGRIAQYPSALWPTLGCLVCGFILSWSTASLGASKAPEWNKDEFPFCVVESPASISAGSELEFQVALKDIPTGSRIEAALCGENQSGYFDSLLQETPAQPAVANETRTFRYTLDPALTAPRVSLLVRLIKPNGKQETTTYAPCSSVSIRRPAGTKPPAAASQPMMKTVQMADWCRATMPAVIEAGRPFEVKLELTNVKTPNNLSCHLQKVNPDGSYGGMLGYAPPRKMGDETNFTFRYNIPVEEGVTKGRLNVFLSPNGDWAARTAFAVGPELPFECHLPIKPPAADFRTSWLGIDAQGDRVFTEGDRWPVAVDFYLAPCDNWGETVLKFQALGPWIDNPDGKYTQTRGHQPPNLTRFVPVKPGRGTVHFPLVIPAANPRNGFLCLASFRGADQKLWPWEVRMPGPWFQRKETQFLLTSAQPGNLFTYETPLEMLVQNCDPAVQGQQKKLHYRLFDTEGAQVATGNLTVTMPAAGATVPLPLQTARRGVMVLEVDLEGVGQRSTTLARIPDVPAVAKGAPGHFGMTDGSQCQSPQRAEEQFQIARKLGFGVCRLMLQWRNFNPAPGDWRLDQVDRFIDSANRHGIRPWLCLTSPPAWIQKGDTPSYVGYAPFAFDEEGWRGVADFLARRYKGRILGFEWLNEIVPGNKTAHPVEDYLRFCRIGTAAVKAVDPAYFIQLAGGLWPRNYRNDLLKAGVAGAIDCLPVHYSNGQAVLDARADLAAAGGTGRIQVWDNETGQGISTWNVPPREAIQSDLQGNWILNNWSDELVAGVDKIVFFGGWPDAAGNWSYLMDDLTPRPVAATLAVFTSKLFDARPVGKFFLPGQAVFHLFEKDGRAILVASTSAKAPETVQLPVGAAEVTVTDWQGNESRIAARDGVVELPLGLRRVFVEGAELDVLKAQLAVTVADAVAAQSMPQPFSSATILRSVSAPQVPVVVRNILSKLLQGTTKLRAPDGGAPNPEVAFALQPGETRELRLPLTVPPTGLPEGSSAMHIETVFAQPANLPRIDKPIVVNIISPALLGNLLVNGDFESPRRAGDKTPPGWNQWSNKAEQADAKSLGLGLGNLAAKFVNVGSGWESLSQNVASAHGGKVYLYSAWIWNTAIRAGSNVMLYNKDGTSRMLTIPSVFDAGENSASWKLYSCHIEAGPDVDHIGVTPIANGGGQAYFDNVRLTVYEGTDYAAEGHQATQPPRIDGQLDDWTRKCPVPLLGENQLVPLEPSYAWKPDRLSGVAYFSWDAKNLYVAIEVLGGSNNAQTDERTLEGDSIQLAIHPANRKDRADGQAFQYWISKAAPGGGSGKFTLYRPAAFCGGLSSGHLARDSSVHEIAVSTQGKLTTYEIRIPLSELGLSSAGLGTKIGLAIKLNDGRKAFMLWGGGLYPAWSPRHLGVLTFVE